MKSGDIVVVLGKVDSRIREHNKDELVVGTLDTHYGDTATVLLPNGDIWRGLRREIRPHKEQL